MKIRRKERPRLRRLPPHLLPLRSAPKVLATAQVVDEVLLLRRPHLEGLALTRRRTVHQPHLANRHHPGPSSEHHRQLPMLANFPKALAQHLERVQGQALERILDPRLLHGLPRRQWRTTLLDLVSLLPFKESVRCPHHRHLPVEVRHPQGLRRLLLVQQALRHNRPFLPRSLMDHLLRQPELQFRLLPRPELQYHLRLRLHLFLLLLGPLLLRLLHHQPLRLHLLLQTPHRRH